jgi:hypothetical protein
MIPPVAPPSYDVARKGTPLGSYTLAELAAGIGAGNLLWTDDCWTEGMESWCKLSDIKDQVDSIGAAATGASLSRRIPLVVGVIGFCLLLTGAAAYLLLSRTPDPESPGTSSASTAPAASTTPTPRDKPLSMGLSEVQDRISMLAGSSFIMTKDADGVTRFAHRYYQRVGNRIPLRVQIDADGRCRLQTFYHGRSWIFHNQLRFAFDKQTLSTSVMPAHRCVRGISDDNSVSESCLFDGADDMRLVGRLAAARSPVTLQMLGRTPVERPLSHETMEALKESHEFAVLLARRRKLIEDLSLSP